MAPLPDPLPHVRKIVRSLLLSSKAFNELEPEKRTELAESMVKVCHAAATLVREEVESDAQTRAPRQRAPALAMAQSAGSAFSGVAAERVAGTTQQILNAVSFPRFVTDLINGVFKAMIDSSIQQMNAFVELLNNVASSTEGFADSQLSEDRARQWLVEHYGSLQLVPSEDGDEGGGLVVELREGASMPSAEALRTDLGLGPDESVPAGDPEALVPFARRHLAKSRQGMLATMVMLGMQRIVVESGRINASMRFHIDTRSVARDDRGSRFDMANQINAAGSYGFGAWGASASISNTIGYVSTERTQTTEEMNTELDLNSSVEVVFKSDYLPLNRLDERPGLAHSREQPQSGGRSPGRTAGARCPDRRPDRGRDRAPQLARPDAALRRPARAGSPRHRGASPARPRRRRLEQRDRWPTRRRDTGRSRWHRRRRRDDAGSGRRNHSGRGGRNHTGRRRRNHSGRRRRNHSGRGRRRRRYDRCERRRRYDRRERRRHDRRRHDRCDRRRRHGRRERRRYGRRRYKRRARRRHGRRRYDRRERRRHDAPRQRRYGARSPGAGDESASGEVSARPRCLCLES
jgi:hypothetical protein